MTNHQFNLIPLGRGSWITVESSPIKISNIPSMHLITWNDLVVFHYGCLQTNKNLMWLDPRIITHKIHAGYKTQTSKMCTNISTSIKRISSLKKYFTEFFVKLLSFLAYIIFKFWIFFAIRRAGRMVHHWGKCLCKRTMLVFPKLKC